MEEKLNGIVLSGVSYAENDKILSIFTIDKGVISAKIKGVKKAGAKLKFASEPFCFAEFILSVRGDFSTVIGASLLDSFYPLREDLVKYFSGAAVLEFVKKILPYAEVSKELFVLVVETLKGMAYSEENAKSLLIKFLISALKISGYGLCLDRCKNCFTQDFDEIYFDHNNGGFLCGKCFNGEGRKINYSTYENLFRVEKGDGLENEFTEKPLRLLDYYISSKIEVNLKSLKELLKL